MTVTLKNLNKESRATSGTLETWFNRLVVVRGLLRCKEMKPNDYPSQTTVKLKEQGGLSGLCVKTVQFYFISVAPNHNNTCLKGLEFRLHNGAASQQEGSWFKAFLCGDCMLSSLPARVSSRYFLSFLPQKCYTNASQFLSTFSVLLKYID